MLNQTKKNWEKTANIANKYGKDGCISALKEAIDNLLIQQRKELIKTFDKTIGTKFEIAENNFKAGQKKERENMIKVIEGMKKEKCIWEKRDIIAGVGAGSNDYFCIKHNRFSGDNHLLHPKGKDLGLTKERYNQSTIKTYNQALEEIIKALKDNE